MPLVSTALVNKKKEKKKQFCQFMFALLVGCRFVYSFLEANAEFSLFTQYANDFQYIAAHVLDSYSEGSQLVFANV